MNSEEHMKRQLLLEVNKEIDRLVKSDVLDLDNFVLINRIVLVIMYKLRRFLRRMNKRELRGFIRDEIPALKKVKASVKKTITEMIEVLLSC